VAPAILGALLAEPAQVLVLGTQEAQGQEPAAARTTDQEQAEAQALALDLEQSPELAEALEAEEPETE